MSHPDLAGQLAPIIDTIIEADLPLGPVLHEIEKQIIDKAIRAYGGNITNASRHLGIHRNTLHAKVRMHDPQRRAEKVRRLREKRSGLQDEILKVDHELRRARRS
jgi:DNA-binding NtrC family response regulator